MYINIVAYLMFHSNMWNTEWTPSTPVLAHCIYMKIVEEQKEWWLQAQYSSSAVPFRPSLTSILSEYSL